MFYVLCPFFLTNSVLIKDTKNYLQSIISHGFPAFSAYFITDNVPFDFPSQKATILSAYSTIVLFLMIGAARPYRSY